MEPFTTDTFFNGRIRLKQQRCGYRYSLDAVILARSVHVRAGERVLDLGTGCGIIPVVLSFLDPTLRIWAVEIQPQLAVLAAANVRDNRMDSNVTILQADLRRVAPEVCGGPVDQVVSNPPYHRGRSGRTNPNRQRALARHEISMTLPDLVAAARRMLKTGGRFATVYAAERTAELLDCMRCEGIEPKRLRSIHPAFQADARIVVVDGIKGGRPGISIASPLIVHDDRGDYTPEIERMFRP